VDIKGENGVVEANADRDVTVTVENGELIAFGSGIQSTTKRYHTGTFPTDYGRAMAVVRATGGTLKLTATAEDMAAECTVAVK